MQRVYFDKIDRTTIKDVKVNTEFWLATWAGKMHLPWLLGISRLVPALDQNTFFISLLFTANWIDHE